MQKLGKVFLHGFAALFVHVFAVPAQAAIIHMEADLLFSGSPDLNSRNFTLRLFDASTGGNQLYQSADGLATSAGGHFSVDFGEGAFGGPIDDSLIQGSIFVELLVGGRTFDRVEFVNDIASLSGFPGTTDFQIDATFSASPSSPVPEPGSLVLVGLGLLGLSMRRDGRKTFGHRKLVGGQEE